MMKKIICILITVTLLMGAMPLTAVAEEQKEIAAFGNVVSDTYLAPITVEDGAAYQSGAALDTVTQDGSLLLDVEAVAQNSAQAENGEIVLPTEEGNIVLTAGSDEATVTADGEETVVSLETAVTETEGTLYAPLDDLAQLCCLESFEVDGRTVYAKPYQTKRLLVQGEVVPDCGAVDSESAEGGYTVLSFATEADTEAAYRLLSADRRVTEVSCENIYTVSDYTASDFSLNENLSWGADYIDSPQLVEYVEENGVSGTVTVGIVDTGINTKHSFLKDRIVSASASCVDAEPTVEDQNGHGSHVAGIIADNTPENVKILAAKGLNGNGQGTDADLAAAIRYAADHGAEVINMSFGGLNLFGGSVLKNAVQYAYDKGVILVAAAGNEGMDAGNTYPASSPYCITVAATDALGEPAFFSNYGKSVDVAAPGVNINSAFKKGSSTDVYRRESGTSMATPFVVAACADARLLNGKMSFAKMKQYITGKVTPYGQSKNYYGTGIISLTDYCGVTRSDPVIFSEKSGYYTDTLTVSLHSDDAAAKIYYTTDGSAPSEANGSLYTAPLTLADDTELKAVAYSDGKYKSKTTKAAYHFSEYDFDSNYTIDSNGVITAYKGELTILTVPDKINGKTVTGIASNAFRSQLLMSIVLPDTVKEITAAAFYNCASLTTVIAKGVTKIGNNAFNGCNLKYATFGDVTAIGDYAFSGNENLSDETVDLSHVTTIGSYAFYQCALTQLDSDTLTSIGAYAFAGTNLVSVKLNKLKAVSDGLFKGCSSLESVSLTAAATIGKSAFEDCMKLNVAVLSGVKAIGDRAFYGCYPLSSIDTSSVTLLGSEAFVNTAIKSLALPQLQTVPKSAFAYMGKLTSVTLPTQTVIPEKCFFNATALTAIPACFANATLVNESAFENTGLQSIDLKKAVTVKNNAFKNCSKVASVDLPECTFFGENAKLGSEALAVLQLPKVLEFGAVTNAAKLHNVVLPSAVSIGANAFAGCTSLYEVSAPNVQSLGSAAFKDCRSLTALCVHNAQGTLPSNCFYGCSALKEVWLPCITAVGYNAFKGCTALEYVDLSAVTKLDTATVFASAGYLKHLIAPKVKTPETAPVLDNSTVTLTNKLGESVSVLCGDALFESVANGQSIQLPAGAAVRVLYNGTFTSINAGGAVVLQQPTTFDFTVNSNTTMTSTGVQHLRVANISGVSDTDYTGAPIIPAAVLTANGKTLQQNRDYQLMVLNNREGGTATAVFTGIGNFSGTVTRRFKIKPVSIYKCKITPVPDQLYTGQPIEPAVTVTLNGRTVTDYTVSYSNNTQVGEAKITLVSGGTSLLDTTAVTFKIKKTADDPKPAPAKNGWLKENGKWVYYRNNVKQKGWQKLSGKWYYFNTAGVMQTGWQKISNKWYYFNASGAMLTGWQKLSGSWYLFNSSGAMLTGWQKSGGKWYYFNASGAMKTGWLKSGGSWYYLESSGAMAVSKSVKIGGKTYRFNSAGVCTNP